MEVSINRSMPLLRQLSQELGNDQRIQLQCSAKGVSPSTVRSRPPSKKLTVKRMFDSAKFCTFK